MRKNIDVASNAPLAVKRAGAISLLANDTGAIAMMFAICASLMIGALCTGLDTIDYERSQARSQMAEDVAALTAGADLSHFSSNTGSNLTQWQADALAYFNANMPSSYFDLVMPSTNFTATVSGSPATGQTINLSVTGTMTLLAPIIFAASSGSGSSGSSGSSQTPTTATVSATNSVTRIPQGTLELVMVLDNTGSMSDSANGTTGGASKLQGLQAASYNLLQNLYAQNSSNTYVGLVPFASTVNLTGALLPNGSWLKQAFTYNPTGVQMAADSKHPGWGGCAVEPRDANGYLYPQLYSPTSTPSFTPYYYNVPPAGLQLRTYNVNNFCSFPTTTISKNVPLTIDGYGEPNFCGYPASTQGTGVAVYYDQAIANGYGTSTLTQNSDCINHSVTFLTTNQATLTTAIGNMTAGGSTIIPEGLLWGWRMLASSWSNNLANGNGWISSDSTLPRPEVTQGLQRVMIVLTDGENQIGAAGTIPNDIWFNGLSGVGTNSLAAPTVIRADGTTLINGLTDSSELHGGNPEDASSGNNAGWPDDVNSFQASVCTAIKQSGVTVYAITFGDDASNSVAQTAMSNCASPGDYYHAPDNATLNSIFQQIAASLGVLKLSQ